VSSPRESEGGGRRRRRGEVRHLPPRNEEPSCSCRCPYIVVLQKSAERPRAQRSAPPVATGSKASSQPGAREREPDHRRSSGAQAQEATGGKRGADHRELGDPHHVSAASSVKAARFRSCFGAGGMRVASVGGRHPGSVKRTPFTRPPRNRSWRPPSRCVSLEEKRAHATGTEEATGVSEAVGCRFHTAEDNATA